MRDPDYFIDVIFHNLGPRPLVVNLADLILVSRRGGDEALNARPGWSRNPSLKEMAPFIREVPRESGESAV